MRTLKSGLTIGMLVAALAMTGGCGENDNSTNSPNNTPTGNPTPKRTSTPVTGATSTLIAATTTPAPEPTSTPGGQTTAVTVSFPLTATTTLQGLQFAVVYPTVKGSFSGTGDAVVCGTGTCSGGSKDGQPCQSVDPAKPDCPGGTCGGRASGVLTRNDEDNGTLKLSLADPPAIAFPVTIRCVFDENAGQTLSTSDLTTPVTEVTNSGGTPGDPTSLSIGVTIP
jgi:hypothetical protein